MKTLIRTILTLSTALGTVIAVESLWGLTLFDAAWWLVILGSAMIWGFFFTVVVFPRIERKEE